MYTTTYTRIYFITYTNKCKVLKKERDSSQSILNAFASTIYYGKYIKKITYFIILLTIYTKNHLSIMEEQKSNNYFTIFIFF